VGKRAQGSKETKVESEFRRRRIVKRVETTRPSSYLLQHAIVVLTTIPKIASARTRRTGRGFPVRRAKDRQMLVLTHLNHPHGHANRCILQLVQFGRHDCSPEKVLLNANKLNSYVSSARRGRIRGRRRTTKSWAGGYKQLLDREEKTWMRNERRIHSRVSGTDLSLLALNRRARGLFFLRRYVLYVLRVQYSVQCRRNSFGDLQD